MKTIHIRALIVLGTLLVLSALNVSILGKERIRSDGVVAYLPLAPVDPRSLMQGDYMALRFRLAQKLESTWVVPPGDGETRWVEVAVDADRVARSARPGPGELIRLRYRVRDGHVWLGTNAFFFEEGSAERFSGARYGEFRVDRASGEAVLVGLRDGALRAL